MGFDFRAACRSHRYGLVRLRRPERPRCGEAATSAMTALPKPLLGCGLLAGAYAIVPGFYLDGLRVRPGLEIVDHVVPGALVLATVAVAIIWRSGPTLLGPGTGVVVLTAGLWMTASHVGLVAQAIRHEAPASATIFHSSTAAVVVLLGVTWVWRAWPEPADIGRGHAKVSLRARLDRRR